MRTPEQQKIIIDSLLESTKDAAFPMIVGLEDKPQLVVRGLVKRELFAALAMQGLLSRDLQRNSPEWPDIRSAKVRDQSPQFTASEAVELADALIEKLGEKK